MNNLPDAKLKKLLEKYIDKPNFEDTIIKIHEELKRREEMRKKLNVSKYYG